jgi:co-chaperonin GroES (HSP10)
LKVEATLKAFEEAQAKAEEVVKPLSALPEVVSNTSGIEPEGHAVLLLPYKPDIESSPIYIPDDVRRGMDMYEMRGIVVAVGPDCWPWWKRLLQIDSRRARVGDKVLVSKFCGAILRGPLDDIQYRMVNAGDIFARITGEKESDNG